MKKFMNLLPSLMAIVIACFLYELRDKATYLRILVFVFMLYALLANKKQQSIKSIWPVLPVLFYVPMRLWFECDAHLWRFWQPVLIYAGLILLSYFAGFFILKWKVVQKNYNLALLMLISFALAILSGDISWRFQFFAVGLVYLVAPYIACRYITQKKYVAWVIIAPFMLIYSLAWLFEDGSIYCLPITVMPAVSAGIYYIARLFRQRVITVAVVVCYIVFLAYGWYAGMDNYRQRVDICWSE
jgi:hypothetical protein